MKKKIKETARYLRTNQTDSEKILWGVLRNRKVAGVKFLRQHPFSFRNHGRNRYFIADFYCAEKKMIIELDGKIHENCEEYDELRTMIINDFGIRVLRIKNEDLVDMDGGLKTIKNSI